MKDCKFCNEGKDIIPIMNQGVVLNRKLYEDENFYVTVSIGALAEGHLIIIPKKHYLSAGEFENNIMNKFISLQKRLIEVLKKLYGKKVISFEHGTGKYAVTSAASVIHAHVHLVPVNDSLIPEIKDDGCKITQIESFYDLQKCADLGESYIVYQDVDRKLYLVEKKEKQSQFFRKLICDTYNTGEWDWHKDYKEDNIIKTVEKFNSNWGGKTIRIKKTS